MTNRCTNLVEGTNARCGDPFGSLRRYCSPECAEREGKAELEELGITPDMMKEALDGYYECSEMIKAKEQAIDQDDSERASHSPCESSPDRSTSC